MTEIKSTTGEPFDLDEMSRLIEEKPEKRKSRSEDPITIEKSFRLVKDNETTVDLAELDRLKAVSTGACIGCMVAALVFLAAAIGIPFMIRIMNNAIYWIGLAGEAASVGLWVLAYWIKNYVIGD